ncbi:zinc finger protein 239-like isoform X2 [Periplaneta americana]|uniref:zinc finger protein 239-like isoform X2 n=1 Tax=Periplaneta americana TaxID=6978 RepID=UPI0037E83934
MGNRKRCLSVQQKCDIIKCLQNGDVVSDIASRYGIGMRTIFRIKQNRTEILEMAERVKNSDGDAGRRKVIKSSTSAFHEFDNAMFQWFKVQRARGISVSGPVLCEKALDLNRKMGGDTNFKASSGWLKAFKSRHGIRKLSIQVTMDVIKVEPEVDPLAIQSCDDPNSLPDEGVLLPPFVSWTTTDHGYNVKEEVKIEDTPASITFPAVKFESDEDIFGSAGIKEEIKPEVTTEESESVVDTDEMEATTQEDTSDNPASGSTLDSRMCDLASQSSCDTNKGTFRCDVCGKFLKSRDSLRVHSRGHTDEGTFKCDVCGKSLLNRESLRVHSRRHSDTRAHSKTFKCDVCGKCCTTSGNLAAHMRSHTGEKPFKCHICGKCFSHAGGVVHVRTHTGEKPYTCNICGKHFSASGSLKVHTRRHTGDKPLKCGFCGKCFASWSCHRAHVRTHTGEKPFKCETCGKCFAQSGTLVGHVRTHTGEKPFTCDFCGKCFSVTRALKAHIRTHPDKRPSSCGGERGRKK